MLFAKEINCLIVRAATFVLSSADMFSTPKILFKLLIWMKRPHKSYRHVFLPFSVLENSYRQSSRTIVNNLEALWERLR